MNPWWGFSPSGFVYLYDLLDLTYCSCMRHRKVCALKQPCNTTPPPRPVPRQLLCFIHSETQDFAVFSDIIEPAASASLVCPLVSSHATLPYSMMFGMRFSDMGTTCPKYESRPWSYLVEDIPVDLEIPSYVDISPPVSSTDSCFTFQDCHLENK